MRWIVGIDEVGRGALAGPVVVAAAALPRGLAFRNRALGALKDSKKLTAARREAWLAHFRDIARGGGRDGSGSVGTGVAFALARVYPRRIERWNISRAANVAAEQAFSRLTKGRRLPRGTAVFMDGGLFLGDRRSAPPAHARTIVKGDEKINAIKVASIVAKVHRDRFMRRLAKRYPRYGFDIHKGYGTAMHRRAVARYGPCPAHRLTFIKKSSTIRT